MYEFWGGGRGDVDSFADRGLSSNNECKRYGWVMKVVLDHSTTGNSIWGILFVDIHILLHDITQLIG